MVEPFVALVKSGALEKFQAAPVEAPLELSGLASELQHAVSSVGVPVPRVVTWAPHQ